MAVPRCPLMRGVVARANRFVRGSPASPDALLRAGAPTAAHVLVLKPTIPPMDATAVDHMEIGALWTCGLRG
mgnify:CR=1 FL=1